MTDQTDQLLVSLDEPRYSYAEADRIAGVGRGTSKRWLKGSQYQLADNRTVHQPPIASTQPVERGVSFLELIEVAAIGRLKELHFTLQRLRRLMDEARTVLGVSRPLVELRFRTDGRALFVQQNEGESLVSISQPKAQQAWDEVLDPFLTTVEYAGDLAHRWWPMGREQHVMVDPEYGFGQPVVADTGVRTEILWEQFVSGSTYEQIALDFAVEAHLVEKALQFEARHHDALFAST